LLDTGNWINRNNCHATGIADEILAIISEANSKWFDSNFCPEANKTGVFPVAVSFEQRGLGISENNLQTLLPLNSAGAIGELIRCQGATPL